MPESPKLTPTRTTRIAGDISAKLDDVLDVLGLSSAEYLDPLIRRQIENDHAASSAAIQAMKDARAACGRDAELAPTLGGES